MTDEERMNAFDRIKQHVARLQIEVAKLEAREAFLLKVISDCGADVGLLLAELGDNSSKYGPRSKRKEKKESVMPSAEILTEPRE